MYLEQLSIINTYIFYISLINYLVICDICGIDVASILDIIYLGGWLLLKYFQIFA